MDSVRDLFSVFLKIAIALFVIVLVLRLSSVIPRGTKDVTTQASSTPKVDILPSPRKYHGFFTSSSTGNGAMSAPVFTTPPSFSYSGPIAFSSDVGNPIKTTEVVPPQDAGNSRSLNVRNLSIYEGGSIYTGLSFVGEARSTLLRDGKFPVVVIDGAGRVIGVSAAVAQSAWAVPGWVRFETRINYVLPNKVPCTIIFEEALTQTERTRPPLRVPLPVRCN